MKNLGALLRPFGLFALLLLAMLSVSRGVLVLWQWDRVVAADMLGPIFLQGFRFDLILLGFFLIWPMLLLPLFCTSEFMLKGWRPGLLGYFLVCLGASVFLEASTMPFIAQFDARPNRLFFEYLGYPKEIVSTLKAAYVTEISVATLLIAGVLWVARRLLGSRLAGVAPVSIWIALLLTPTLAFGCLAMMRSTLDNRAVNPSTVALSTDPMVNDLALNSGYSVLYALVEESSEPDGGLRYSDMPADEVVAVVRDEMHVDPATFVDAALPTLHRQTATRTYARPKNLVIVLEESLGAEFVGALGGLPLTPNIDALAQEGLWFENLFATGIRSVRGIEAVITGFTPTPARSTVKLGGSQRNFFTLAQLLRGFGYETSFIYGGESHFDNMRRFFMNNGFEKVIDENDYDDAVFFGAWGASDEDLFRHAHDEFERLGDRPFFSLVFTTSNHTPYEFPDGRIELYDEQKATVNNAVKYADYAVGQFIERARASSYWEDTVFVIVADHNSRVYGPDVVPVDHFHIPALVLGADIEPFAYEPVASQIDLAPTLLSLIGISSEHPMIGHDLTRPEFADVEGRAIMQFVGTQGYMQGDEIVVLRKDLAPEQFTYDGAHLTQSPMLDPDLLQLSQAHASWSSLAYEEKLYRLP
ncbi:MAG: LTA synthase family protein [Gammaproteobacteria bacterium]|jgi:phosphoglycerol transferase MdoB-like AlkP superfamily enzyme